MRSAYATLALLGMLAVGAGCSRKCEGLEPKAEVAINGSSLTGKVAASITHFRVIVQLDGSKKEFPLTASELTFSAQDRGSKLLVNFASKGVSAGSRLNVTVYGCKSAGDCDVTAVAAQKAVAHGSLKAAFLEPNGCNFFTVKLQAGTAPPPKDGGPPDAGGDSGDSGVNKLLLKLADKADRDKLKVDLSGAATGHQLHRVITCDLNGDTYDDLVVAAPRAASKVKASPAAGRVYIFLTNTGGASVPRKDLSKADVIIYGGDKGGQLGSSLACGNLDKSSYQDLVMGAPYAGKGSVPQAGKVYVLYGGASLAASGYDLEGDHTPANMVQLQGWHKDDHTGLAVAAVDLGGDGFPFVAMGAPGFDAGAGAYALDSGAAPDAGADAAVPGRVDAGAVFLVGHTALAGNKGKVMDLSQSVAGGGILLGGVAGEKLGTALAAGNLDGAQNSKTKGGHQDLAAGGPGATGPAGQAGVVRVLMGSKLSGPMGQLDSASAAEVQSVWAPDKTLTGFGDCLVVGRLNKDNYADLLVGAYITARAHVYLGDVTFSGATKSGTYFKGPPNSQLGAALALVPRSKSAAPINDLLLGAPNGEQGAGTVYWWRSDTQDLKSGGEIGLSKSKDTQLELRGAAAGDKLGTSVAAGFFTIDGVADLFAGAPDASAGLVVGYTHPK